MDEFDKGMRAAKWFGVAVLLGNLAFFGVLAWGVVELILWITSK